MMKDKQKQVRNEKGLAFWQWSLGLWCETNSKALLCLRYGRKSQIWLHLLTRQGMNIAEMNLKTLSVSFSLNSPTPMMHTGLAYLNHRPTHTISVGIFGCLVFPFRFHMGQSEVIILSPTHYKEATLAVKLSVTTRLHPQPACTPAPTGR